MADRRACPVVCLSFVCRLSHRTGRVQAIAVRLRHRWTRQQYKKMPALNRNRSLKGLDYRTATSLKFKLSPYELQRIQHGCLRHIDHSLKWRVEINDHKH